MIPETMTIGLLVLTALGLISFGAKTGVKAARGAREVTRIGGSAGRTLLTAGVIVGVQWAVITLTTSPLAWGVALGVPALFAGVTVARLLAVTTVIRSLPSGSRR